MPRKILVILGHPKADSFCGNLALHYVEAAEEAGHEVEAINVSELDFDLVLRDGHDSEQALEDDLQMAQEKIKWADHLVIIYPNWWLTMPAILKGFFDRIWLPEFSFTNLDGKLKPLLQGKTARVIATSGFYSPLKAWWKFGDHTNELQYGILEFSGIKSKVSVFGPTKEVSEETYRKWLKQVEKIARLGI